MGIAQVVNVKGTLRLRDVFGSYLDGSQLASISTEQPRMPVNEIKNVYFKCTFKDEDYSLTVGWKNHDSMMTNLHNVWNEVTLSVNLSDFECESCDDQIDCSAVSCALASQFYGKYLDRESLDNSVFLQNSIAIQNDQIDVDIHPILSKEVKYCVTAFAGSCGDCSEISGIGGIRIKADATLLDADGAAYIGTDVDVLFTNTASTTAGRSYLNQKDSILKQLNQAFIDNGVTGHAVAMMGIDGDARPCSDFEIMINSCYSVQLLDTAGVVITPCTAEYNPFTGKKFYSSKECVGCTPNTSFVPNCGIRVVPKGIKVDTSCLSGPERKAWYHTQVRVSTPVDSNFKTFHQETMQEIVVAENLGLQFYPRMLDQEGVGFGFDYNEGYSDMGRSIYGENKADRLKYHAAGLNQRGLYTTISWRSGIASEDSFGSGAGRVAMGQTWMLIESTDAALKASVKAIMDPWLASLPNPRGPLQLTTDDDQINTVVDASGTVTQEAADKTGE